MKVKFEFEDKHGYTNSINYQEADMSEAELTALFNSDEVIYPVPYGNGSITSKRATIVGKEFDMFRLPETFLKVTLREVE